MNITYPTGSIFFSNRNFSRRPAKHRFHSIGSRSLEKLRSLSFAMKDRRWKDISEGKIQIIAPNYGILRFNSTHMHYDPYDFRDAWKKEWEKPLNEGERYVLNLLSEVLNKKPEELEFDRDGFVDTRQLIHFMNHQPNGATHPFTLDRLVWNLRPRKFAYKEQKKRVGLVRPCDIFTIQEDESCPPPDTLYHATLLTNVRDLDCEGIQPVGGSFVSLAETTSAARSYFTKKKKIFVYQIDAKKMRDDGFLFCKGNENTWRTNSVPLQYLSYV